MAAASPAPEYLPGFQRIDFDISLCNSNTTFSFFLAQASLKLTVDVI